MANDNEPTEKNVDTNHIEVTGKKTKPEAVQVKVEFTKRRQLDAVLDLLDGFTPREVRQIVKVYKRKRKTAKLAQQNTDTVKQILEG